MTYIAPKPATAETLTPNIFQTFSQFINQKPGLEFADYGDRSAYRSDAARILRDKKRAMAALYKAESFPFNPQALIDATRAFSGRLEILEGGKIGYTTGQYWPTEYRTAAATVLESYIEAVRPKQLPQPTDVFYDIHHLEAANERAGGHWFSRDNKRFARSRVHPGIYKGQRLIWFVSSEKSGFDDRSARKFSVRVFDTKDASVNTAGGGFLAYSDLADARRDAREFAKRDLAGEHVKPTDPHSKCRFCGSYGSGCSGN